MTLWGGRFAEGPDELLWRFTVDHSDRRLLVDDIVGSQAHAAMLTEVGILSVEEGDQIQLGLSTVLAEAQSGEFGWSDGDEDVHSAVERRLYELIGGGAGKLHTGRSRNDQICLDLRLYLRRAAGERAVQITDLIRVTHRSRRGSRGHGGRFVHARATSAGGSPGSSSAGIRVDAIA